MLPRVDGCRAAVVRIRHFSRRPITNGGLVLGQSGLKQVIRQNEGKLLERMASQVGRSSA
jgi:hypothetical protein